VPDVAADSPFKQAWLAAKANLVPAAFLWAAAASIILLYTFVPSVKEVLDDLAAFKQRNGYAFSAVSTPIFAVLLPLSIQRLARAVGSKAGEPEPLYNVPLLVAFWAYRGAEIDGLYRLQAWAWGEGRAWWQLLVKVFIDQCGYVMCWAIPTMILVFLFKDCGYSIGRARRELGPKWYRNRCAGILIVNWVVWIPAVVVIYSLPLGLQLPVMNLNVCLFVLLVMFATGRGREPVTAP